MERLKKRLLATTLILTTLLAMFAVLMRSAGSTEYINVDDYCWIEGENLDIGFSKYGEMIGYNEDTETGLGIQYPGYESAGNTYDQGEGTSVDPFANEEICVDWWMNGWFIDIKYRTPPGEYREIWAFAMSTDGQQHGGDWIVMPSVAADSSARPLWQEYPPYANPDSTPYMGIVDPIPESGGRKTNGHAETDPIEIVYNGPRKFIAICKTRISDAGTGLNLVDLTFTFIFNKAEKNIILLKDVYRLYPKSRLNIQFGNRGQWDLGISPDIDSYIHWYTSEPVKYWDQDGDGAINCTEVEASFETFRDYFLTNKHPEKWWDEVPSDERPTTVCDEWTEEMIPFPETWLEAQEGSYGLEGHRDPTIKGNSYAVAQVIAQDGDYVGALAVWPHPEFWSASSLYYPPARTVAPTGNNPSSLPLMLSPISRVLEWYKWTVEEDPLLLPDYDVPDRDDVWVTADDIRYPDGSTLEPTIPFIIYEHDFELSASLPEYRAVLVYTLTERHDGDDRDAKREGNVEDWSSGVNQIDSEIQYHLDQIFGEKAFPVASFTYEPSTPHVGEAVIFNATASYDLDGIIINYYWDFGDGTQIDVADPITTHTYTSPSVYDVTLSVTDNEWLTSTTSQPIAIEKVSSTISISVSPPTITIEESTTINGSITPTRVGATVTISYRMIGESWNPLATMTTDENSQYSYTWTPSEIGTYEVKAGWLGDENTLPAESSIGTIDVIPPRILSIRLSGEHDYLFMEGVKIRLSALVKDAATMEPISNANVTIEIYDANGNLWVSDMMVERLAGTGIYEWESEETIRKLRLEKGVYLAHVSASSQGSLTTSDILEFHIDPPVEDPVQLHLALLFTLAATLAIAISVWYVDHRRLAGKFSKLEGKMR